MFKTSILLLLCLTASAQTIRTAFPRIYFSEAEWNTVAAKRTGTAAEQAYYNEVYDYARVYCSQDRRTVTYPTSNPYKANAGCAQYLAILHKADPANWSNGGGVNNEPWLDRACGYLDWQINRHKLLDDGVTPDRSGRWDYDSAITDNNGFRWGATGTAHAYDLLRDECGPDVKTHMYEFAGHVWRLRAPGTYGVPLIIPSASVNNNIGIGTLLGTMQIMISAYDPTDFVLPQTTYLPAYIDLFRRGVIPCLSNSTANHPMELCFGGSWQEGWQMYAGETLVYMIGLVDSMRVGTTDLDFWNEISPNFPRDVLRYLQTSTTPTGPQGAYWKYWQPYPLGDVENSPSISYGVGSSQLHQGLTRLQLALRSRGFTIEANQAQWMVKNFFPYNYFSSPASGQTADTAISHLLWESPESPSVDHRASESVDYITPFALMSRTSWAEDATFVGFTTRADTGQHSHGDGGQFQIYRKGQWVTREMPGYFNTTWVNVASSHNTITVNNHGQWSSAARQGTLLSNGLYPAFTRTTSGYKANCRAGYCAAEAEMSQYFKFSGQSITPDVSSVYRNFLYLKPDMVIVSDRVKYVAGLNTRTITHLQSNETLPTVSGNTSTISWGTQRLHTTLIAPDALTQNIVQTRACMVQDVKIIDANNALVYVDCGSFSGTSSITITGLTGAWTPLNGTWTFTTPTGSSQTTPYSDGVAYNGERFKITIPGGDPRYGSFSTIPADFPASQVNVATTSRVKDVRWPDPAETPLTPGLSRARVPYRIDIMNTTRSNAQSRVMIMQAADSTDAVITVTDASLTADAGTFTVSDQRYIVVSPRDYPVVLPLTYYAGSGDARHLVMGLTASTAYTVEVLDGIATIRANAGGVNYTTDAAGVLDFGAASSVTDPVIATTSLPDGVVGTGYLFLLAANLGTPPYTWSLTSGSLPTGLSLSSVGQITGTPTTAAVSSPTIRVTDAVSATATRAFTLTVTAPGGTVTGTVDVSVYRRGSSAIVTIRGVADAAQGCVVDAIQGATVVVSNVSEDILRVRRVPLSNLDPTQAYTFRATCGANVPLGQVDSGVVDGAAVPAVAATPTVDVPISASGTHDIEYGNFGASCQPVTTYVSAVEGVATITGHTPGTILRYRRRRGNVCGAIEYRIP